MQMQVLFDLVESAQGIADWFEGVEGVPQLVSRLETLKHKGSADLLEDLEALRINIAAFMTANIELGGSLGGESAEEDTDDLLRSLEGFPDENPEVVVASQDKVESAPQSDNADVKTPS